MAEADNAMICPNGRGCASGGLGVAEGVGGVKSSVTPIGSDISSRVTGFMRGKVSEFASLIT